MFATFESQSPGWANSLHRGQVFTRQWGNSIAERDNRPSDDPKKVEQLRLEQYSPSLVRTLYSAFFRWKRERNPKERVGKTSATGIGFWQQRKGKRDSSQVNASTNATRQFLQQSWSQGVLSVSKFQQDSWQMMQLLGNLWKDARGSFQKDEGRQGLYRRPVLILLQEKWRRFLAAAYFFHRALRELWETNHKNESCQLLAWATCQS